MSRQEMKIKRLEGGSDRKSMQTNAKAEGCKFSLQNCFWKKWVKDFHWKSPKIDTFSSLRSRPTTSMNREEEPIEEETPRVSIHSRPQTSYRAAKLLQPMPVSVAEAAAAAPVLVAASQSSASRFVPSYIPASKVFENHELGSVPDYIKKHRERVAALRKDQAEEFKNDMSKVKAMSQQRPKTARFATRLEKIIEEPEPIGDGEKEEKEHKIDDLKQLVVTTCEDIKKNLLNDIETYKSKADERHQLVVKSTKDKSRDLENLKMKNRVLNTSLLHKVEENAKLKRELKELTEARSDLKWKWKCIDKEK